MENQQPQTQTLKPVSQTGQQQAPAQQPTQQPTQQPASQQPTQRQSYQQQPQQPTQQQSYQQQPQQQREPEYITPEQAQQPPRRRGGRRQPRRQQTASQRLTHPWELVQKYTPKFWSWFARTAQQYKKKPSVKIASKYTTLEKATDAQGTIVQDIPLEMQIQNSISGRLIISAGPQNQCPNGVAALYYDGQVIHTDGNKYPVNLRKILIFDQQSGPVFERDDDADWFDNF